MRRVAEGVRNAGATVTTIGIGVDYNERMMATIASETNGHHHFAETPDALATIFDRELSGLERSVARDVRLELELAPGVELIDVAGNSFTREGRHAKVALGSLSAGEERSVLARVRVASGTTGEREIMTTRVRYEDLDSGTSAEREARLGAFFTGDGSRSRIDPIVEERVERSSTVTALDDANDLFKAGDFEGAREKVSKKLSSVRAGRAAAVAAAPAPKRAALAREFDEQEAALDKAETAFAERPASAVETKSKAKQNQVEAFELTR
jgi:Ca-activated chloride channel family protein